MRFFKGISGSLLVALLSFAACSDDSTAPIPPVDEGPTYETVTVTIGSGDYLNNRFFFLDLPGRDDPGLSAGWRIDPASIQIYEERSDGTFQDGDIAFAAVYEDTTGVFWENDESMEFDSPYRWGAHWRRLDCQELLDAGGDLVAIDLGRQFEGDSTLGVVYRIVDQAGFVVARVGDIPGLDEDSRQEIDGELYYRMKLLKAPEIDQHAYSFDYVLRNIYSLGTANIDVSWFTLQIERNELGVAHPELDGAGLPYIRIFGLDKTDGHGGAPDGVADIMDPYLFNMEKGLLFFPLDFPHPFAADEAKYRYYAESDSFVWDDTFLEQHLAPQLYDPEIVATDYPDYSHFTIRTTYRRQVTEKWEQIPLTRISWSRASLPYPDAANPTGYSPESRVEAIRWFAPEERVLRYYLDPTLSGSVRDQTVPALELFLWPEDGSWEAGDWGGIMHGTTDIGVDISGSDTFEFWINDGVVDDALRAGTLHIDFGRISEDGFWPTRINGELEVGTWQREDGILGDIGADGVFTQEEDIGLDGDEFGPERYDAAYDCAGRIDYPGPPVPYPGINGTARNAREDTEDINGNTIIDFRNTYFTVAVDLSDSAAVDVLRDYEEVGEFVAAGLAWRKYTISLGSASIRSVDDEEPDLSRITHFRIWYEDAASVRQAIRLQFAGLRFVDTEGSR